LAFSQITRTTPLRWITLHLSQIFFTDARTFIALVPFCSASRNVSRGLIPGGKLATLLLIEP